MIFKKSLILEENVVQGNLLHLNVNSLTIFCLDYFTLNSDNCALP